MPRKDARPDARAPGKWKRRLLTLLASLGVIAVCVAIREIGGNNPAGAQMPGKKDSKAAAPTAGNPAPTQTGSATSSQQNIVAVVNGEQIQRNDLAQECLAQFGKEVLEGVMNKYLIVGYCDKKGVKVTRQDVDEEIGRLAKKFSIPVDQWMQMLQQERGIGAEQYRNDIIWPTLALRKLAAERIQPTPQEIDDAFEAQYGVAVRARLIVLDDAATAQQVLAKAKANPDEFGALARKYSKDPTSASLNGLIHPIRRHVGDPAVEDAAFKMKEGEISPVIEVHGQFAILKCEGQTPPTGFTKDQVLSRLEEFVRERKLRSVSADVFKKLQDEAQIVNVYNDPQKQMQMAGVAATINGKTITVRELSEECIARHGDEVLEQLINRKLLEQELKKRNLKVTPQDIDAEIARAAMSAGRITKTGKPDVEGWLKSVIEDQKISQEKYLKDSVWPSTALKLIAGDVKVSEEDIQKGFKANFGTRAQVRAIVLDNQRRAQEVWQQARDNPSIEFFGKLAEQYSIEPASRANQGRVPPIQQFGGQPELEREAFALKPGEISGIIQVLDKYVILYLEGYTDPVKVKIEEVRNDIYEDIHEKKLRMAMGREFERMKDEASIDNFLAGTSHAPQKKNQVAGARSGRGGQAADAGAVPAAYETTGLLPRNPAAAPPQSGAQSGQAAPRSGSVPPPRN